MNLYDRTKTRLFNRVQFALALLQGYCSQDGQDRWVIRDMFHGMRGGYFVDIGAYDGWRSSNSYVLEKKYGWKGLCIEPNPRLFRRLQACRSCTCLEVCIADANREVNFTTDADAWGGIPDYYPANRPEEIGQYWHTGRLYTEDGGLLTVKKQAESLVSVLRKTGAPKVIEYLSIDTEGTEYIILKDFPFEEYTFLTMTVEHFGNPTNRQLIRSLLTSKGYTLERPGKIDDYFSHPSRQYSLQEEGK